MKRASIVWARAWLETTTPDARAAAIVFEKPTGETDAQTRFRRRADRRGTS